MNEGLCTIYLEYVVNEQMHEDMWLIRMDMLKSGWMGMKVY